MKVLVTGATGGLGSLVVKQLLKKGIEVVATSRSEVKAKQWEFFSKVIYIQHDIGTAGDTDLFELFGKPDAMVHLAWDDLNNYRSENHTGKTLSVHREFIFNLLKNGLKNLTVVGTCYEYGLREGELEETMPPEPILPYPEGKNMLREYIETKQQEFDFSFKWARVFYVFGEIKERKNLYTHLMSAIQNGDTVFNMSGGEQVRDFLSPDEIAAILVKIATQKETTGIINCCSGKPVVLKEFVKEFLNKNNFKIQLNLGYFPYPDYEPMKTWGSVKKLNNI